MKITINGNVIEGTPEELAEYYAMVEDFAKADSCEDACCVEEAPYEPKVGDIVKIVSNTTWSSNNVGDIGKIGKLGSDRFTVEVPNGPKSDIWTEAHDVRLATAEEIAQYDKAVEEASKPKLKAGDYVAFTETSNYPDITIGKPYEIYIGKSGKPTFTDDVDDERFVPLTDEDVKYEILEGEALKFVKLGRRVGEIRRGDLVRVTSDHGRHKIGTIGIARQHGTTESTAVVANGISQGTWSTVELIAPVESVLS